MKQNKILKLIDNTFWDILQRGVEWCDDLQLPYYSIKPTHVMAGLMMAGLARAAYVQTHQETFDDYVIGLRSSPDEGHYEVITQDHGHFKNVNQTILASKTNAAMLQESFKANLYNFRPVHFQVMKPFIPGGLSNITSATIIAPPTP